MFWRGGAHLIQDCELEKKAAAPKPEQPVTKVRAATIKGADEEFWIMGIRSAEKVCGVAESSSALMDSGSDDHVCGKAVGEGHQLDTSHDKNLYDVRGHKMPYHGSTQLPVTLGEDQVAAAPTCSVSDVDDVVFSLGLLLRRGDKFDLDLSRGCT